MDDSDERPRGILSPADRRFLRGEADLRSEQSVYDTRYRIRQRVRDALLDFPLLFAHLDDRDREQVFDGDERLADAVVDAVAVLYLAAGDCDSSTEGLFTEGIRRAERERTGGQPTVTLDVETTDRERLERIVETVESGRPHELSDAELRAFAQLCGGDCDRAPREALAAVVEETSGESDADESSGDAEA
jgi:hypothetical protein